MKISGAYKYVACHEFILFKPSLRDVGCMAKGSGFTDWVQIAL